MENNSTDNIQMYFKLNVWPFQIHSVLSTRIMKIQSQNNVQIIRVYVQYIIGTKTHV